ncbi:MAG: alpha-L-fucosidase [Bacteroidales bacterium]|nr:alpha-L-fucosidase [Bacteroidales bacterium]
MKRNYILFAAWGIVFLTCLFAAAAQEVKDAPLRSKSADGTRYADPYVLDQMEPEENPIILERLSEWQDLKLGFMVHWGLYAQWGVVESWSICSEPWISRNGANYMEYVQAYRDLNKTFKPKRFNAERWAKQAKEAGMKYVVFTAKHHDGFCLFDSKYTNYTCADRSCPFSKHAQKDITREVVNAFRSKGMWTGLYFSKPDWHCPDYWAPEWATPDRNVNYDPQEHPDRWQKYKEFTYNQIYELTHNYGSIDILWLDGGWVRPEWSINDEVLPWLGCNRYVQDIDMPHLAQIAREKIPDLLIVDRSVGGRYENYRTPEQQVPDRCLPYPWETCMSLGDGWSFSPNDKYKSAHFLVHTLCDVVAKGGNLLLNVGPDADGLLPDTAAQRLRELGKWMAANGDAIYGTRPVLPYVLGKWRFTKSKDGATVFAIYLLDEGEEVPEVLEITRLPIVPNEVRLLGGGKAKVRKEDGVYKIYVSPSKNARHAIALAFK